MSRRSLIVALVTAYYYAALCCFVGQVHVGLLVALVRSLGWPAYLVLR